MMETMQNTNIILAIFILRNFNALFKYVLVRHNTLILHQQLLNIFTKTTKTKDLSS